MKVCGSCKLTLPLMSFYKNRRQPDGRTRDCKSCTYTPVSDVHPSSVRGKQQCRVCLKELPKTMFTPRKASPTGRLYICRQCSLLRSKKVKDGSIDARQYNILKERLWRLEKKELGLCTRCGFRKLFNATSCKQCHVKRNQDRWSKAERRVMQGKCKQCGKEKGEGKIYCKVCTLRFNRNSRDKANRKKQAARAALGDKCVCCGESIPEFLTIDHINGGGRNENTTTMYHRILSGDHEGLRVLCFNCNCGRELTGGICPHNLQH